MQHVVSRAEWGAAAASAVLLIFSFPDFEFSFLAWVALVPLLVAIVLRPSPVKAFILGWAVGSVFFYATCHWLTYSMIHYGGVPTALAYLLLVPGALVIGTFHGLFFLSVALVVNKWNNWAILVAPAFWVTLEWARLGVTGQLWNALGYSQAFHPMLIQPANWGGVYAVSFLLVLVNAAIALFVIDRSRWSIGVMLATAVLILLVMWCSVILVRPRQASEMSSVNVVALQPNVPMNTVKSVEEIKQLLARHWSMSTEALRSLPDDNLQRLVIWPESPMNFTYASSREFQDLVADFARQNQTSLLFNSLEPAPADGSYNSALLINEEGRLISQYDKIRLMPFGEYVPLPQWLPGASLITGIVGEFTAGDKYTLMPFGDNRAGTFICIESAYPWIARRLTNEGADVLINISNDGYLGPTAVMRQHLANAVFRAVENGRPVVRVTNTGLTALIHPGGVVEGQTTAFETDVRVWRVSPGLIASTFYSRNGDVFVYVCTAITLLVLLVIFFNGRSPRSGRKHKAWGRKPQEQ